MLVKHTGTISPAELFEETKTEMADVEEDYLEMVCVLLLFYLFFVVMPQSVVDSEVQVCFMVVCAIWQVSCPPKLHPPALSCAARSATLVASRNDREHESFFHEWPAATAAEASLALWSVCLSSRSLRAESITAVRPGDQADAFRLFL